MRGVRLLKDALVFWNPWWQDSKEIFPRLKNRKALANIKPIFLRKEVTAITGVRRSGKTSMMYLLIRELLESRDPETIMYVNLDDPGFKGAELNQIFEAYQELMPSQKNSFLFLDEIQNIVDWERWIKRCYDSFQNIKIVISGSNSSLLQTEYSTLLVGRSLPFELFPLSFVEYLQFKDVEMSNQPNLIANKPLIKNLLEEYFKYGGFPEVVMEQDPSMKLTLLKEYFNAILSRDVIARYEIREKKKMERLGVYLLTNISNPLSARSLRSTIGLNIHTVQEYLDDLEAAYLVFFVNHFSYSLKSQYTYPRKVYCVDPGMRGAVSFRFSSDIGRLLENVVFLQLRNLGDVYYWKDGKTDIDFIVKKGENVASLYQVCYSVEDPKTKKREETNLLKTMEHFDIPLGTIITWDHEDTIKSDSGTIEYRPFWKWIFNDLSSS